MTMPTPPADPAPQPNAAPPSPAPTPAPAPPAAAPQQAQPAPAAPPAPPVPSPPPAPPAPEPRDISGLPQWAQKEINDARGDAGKYRTQARTANVQNAALLAAPALGVNPAALLGSTAFAAVAAQLDPKAEGFDASLAAAITATLQANPWMASQQAVPEPPPVPGTSGGQFPGAPGVPPMSIEQQIAEAEAKGDWKLSRQLKSQLLIQNR